MWQENVPRIQRIELFLQYSSLNADTTTDIICPNYISIYANPQNFSHY